MISTNTIIIDCETGGLNPKKDVLLTLAIKFFDSNNQNMIPLNLKIWNDNLNINEKALQINKIDIEKHKKEAISEKEAIKQIISYIEKNKSKNTFKPMILGQNVSFDIQFVSEMFKRNNYDLNSYISYINIDLISITWFINYVYNFENICLPFSLEKIVKLLKIKGIQSHTTIGDVLAVEKILEKYKNMVRK